jgi:hypothetical protein
MGISTAGGERSNMTRNHHFSCAICEMQIQALRRAMFMVQEIWGHADQ